MVILSVENSIITPPVCFNVFATKGAAEPYVSVEDVFKGILSFFFGMLFTLALLIAFPRISPFLQGLIG